MKFLKNIFSKISGWQIGLSLSLIGLSVIFYLLHFLFFKDSHHILIYLVGDIAFVPIEVLLVTLIIHRVLEAREKKSKMRKLNMVIGIFFSEAGTQLLKHLSNFDPDSLKINPRLQINSTWEKKDFYQATEAAESHSCNIQYSFEQLKELKKFLLDHRALMLRLLENPNLLEHEYFTDLLWAVFHLTEELQQRTDLTQGTEQDKNHLCIDIQRAYRLLLKEWLYYMKHLKDDYPHLFSLAVRTNPFNPNPTPYLT